MCAAETASTPYREAAAQAQQRSAVYLMLSRALLYPGPGVEENWQQGMAALEALGEAEGWQGLVLPQDLPEEWVLTFTHSCPKDCPPYETEYDARSAFQQTHRLAGLGGFYKAFGLTAAQGERLDHIGVELEFMYFLTFKEAHAWLHLGEEKAALCRSAQRRFLEEHLGRWAPLFWRLLEKRGAFYARLGRASRTFLEREALRLGAHTSPLEEEAFTPLPESSFLQGGCGED